jgi:hypothetical protein
MISDRAGIRRVIKNKAPCMGETWGHGKEGWEVLNWSKYTPLYNVMQQKKSASEISLQ